MIDLDLTEAIAAAAKAARPTTRRLEPYTDREVLIRHVEAAAPVIERQVRERIAADTREAVEAYLYDGDHDRPLPGYYLMLGFADNVARGGGS